MSGIYRRYAYNETAAASFSLNGFPWREVKLTAAPSFPSKKSSEWPREAVNLAGGFPYRESASSFSPCRNRCILWHYSGQRLKLLELSLDVALVHNALELVLDGSDILLPDVVFHEQGKSSILILFATTSTAYRLILPHPEKIIKTPSLSAAGEGMIPSVLAFVDETISSGPNKAALFNQPSSVIAVTSCVACVDPEGAATFALASPTGVIPIIQLPHPQKQGFPVRSELQEASMMSKLWSSIFPIGGRGGVVAGNAPLSILLHLFNGQAVVIALCADLHLRLWSIQLTQCVMAHNLSQYVQLPGSEKEANMKVDQLLLRGAQDSSPTTLRLAIHMRTPISSQISIFELLLMENQLHLQLLQTFLCPEAGSGALVDFCVSANKVWGAWTCQGRGEEEGDKIVLKQAIYEPGTLFSGWREIALTPFPSKELVVLPHQEPREFFVEAIFHPGRFSTLAITKTLELYAPSDQEPARELAKEVILRVEHELQSSASSLEMDTDEYRQHCLNCWSKFYVQCQEYQQLVSKPLAIFEDSGTGMGVLLKQGVISFLKPADVLECDYETELPLQISNYRIGKDVGKFLCSVRKTVWQLSPDILGSFVLELGRYGSINTNPPISLAKDLADTIHEEALDEDVYSDLCSIRDLGAVMETLFEILNPLEEGVEGGVAEDMEEEEDDYDGYSELLSAVSQLFGSPVSMAILSSAFQEVCHSRLCLSRDILVMLFVLRRGASAELMSHVKKDYSASFSQLVWHYHSLHWLATHTTLPTSITAHEASLQKLASLEISSGHGSSRSGSSLLSPTLPFLYLSTRGHQTITAELAKKKALPVGMPRHSHWTAILPKVVDILVKTLWPETSCSEVAEFLLENGQYTHLQAYISLVGTPTPRCGHSLQYLLGQGFLCVGELEKAFKCLMQAAAGLGSEKNVVLQRLVEWKVEEKDNCLANYFEKVMRLFEQIPAPHYVIKVADSAILLLKNGHPKSTIFWSNLFKYHLDFGHAQEAYVAMTSNPNSAVRMDCLRRLVVVLTEQNRFPELCKFRYIGMEKEIEGVIETRARSVDVMKHNYYDLLYCFHTHRNNFRKAAYVMYEYGLRLGREAAGLESLQQQANCYRLCILGLKIIDPKYAWVVRPVQEGRVVDKKTRSHRKRAHPSQDGSSSKPVEVLTISDIERDYILIKAKLGLIQRESSLITQISNPFVSADEVSALLVQAGMFDAAINLSNKLSLSMTPIFEALASRCIHLSANLVNFGQPSTDKAGWEWVGLNRSLNVAQVKENSIADKAWHLLRINLERLDHDQHAIMQKNVAKKLLAMGWDLPQWMLDTYKRTNPAELLNLYLTFDLLEPALSLAIEYIDGVMGHGKEFFGLQDALHIHSPSVWLPHSLFSHLKLAVQEVPPNSTLEELGERFSEKLDGYLSRVSFISDEMEKLYHRRQPITV